MDFVVIGLGLSALALLTGLTLLCMVAPRWFRKAGAVQPVDAVYARAQAGERQVLGQGFLCAGAVLLLATLGGISAGLTDKAGAYLIASVTTVAALGLFGGDLLYRKHHPIPQRRRSAPRTARHADQEFSSSLPAVTAHASLAATSTTVRRRVLPTRHRVMPAAQAATVTTTAPAIPDTDKNASGREHSHAENVEPPTGTTETEAVASAEAIAPGDQVLASESGVIPEAGPDMIEEPMSQETETGEPSEIAARLPEPVPLTLVADNGTARLASRSASELEPDLAPQGDDRVIALFPTAATRRSRLVVAPNDPDGQS